MPHAGDTREREREQRGSVALMNIASGSEKWQKTNADTATETATAAMLAALLTHFP